MIRKVNSDNYFLDSPAISANFGGWDAGVYRVRAAAAHHEKAMQVFKRASPQVPLNPKRRRKAALGWGDDPDA